MRKLQKGRNSRQRLVKIFVAAACLLLAGAKDATATVSQRASISFEKIFGLRFGSSQKEAESALGRPSKVYRDNVSGETVWLYIDGSDVMNRYQKAGLSFSKASNKLIGFSYSPEPPDEVAHVEGLRKRFPKANFKTVEPSSCGEHFTLNEGFDYDLALGINFKKDAEGRVTHLGFVVPPTEQDRKAASEPTGCSDKSKPRRQFVEITPALK